MDQVQTARLRASPTLVHAPLQTSTLVAAGRRDPSRPRLEAFLRSRYAAAFGARVRIRYPQVFGLLSPADEVVAAAGVRSADAEPLFLECYLERPVESALSAAYGARILRRQIVEIGSFASTGPVEALALFDALARVLEPETGRRFGVATVTAQVHAMLRRAGFPLITLAQADAERVPGAAGSWGSYYQSGPVVVASEVTPPATSSASRCRRILTRAGAVRAVRVNSRLLCAVEAHAAARPGHLALSGEHAALSWRGLLDEVGRTAEWLKAALAEAAPGAPAAIALDNGPAWAVVDLALISLGRPALPLPPFFTAEQRGHALADCGACLVVRPAPSDASGAIVIAGEPLVAAPTGVEPRPLHSGTAKITYTSGSTGRPKGVCLSLDQLEQVAASIVETLGAETAQVHMAALPYGVLLENVAGLYATLMAGGRCHAPGLAAIGFGDGSRPDIARLCEAAKAARATSLILVPEMLRGVLGWTQLSGERLDDLAFVAVGGAKVAPGLIEAARAAGLPVYEGYGLSECGSVVALNTPGAKRRGSVGRPLPHVRLEVHADGELVVGPRPFLGYVGEPPAPALLRTGDLGAMDAEGFVSIDGRKSNLLITAFGRNVAPEWVESELQAQPEIAQALVFGDGAPALSALIVPADGRLATVQLQAAVSRANAALPDYARVNRWRARAPFGTSPGELTGNGRPRREALLAAHQDFIESEG